MILTILDGLLPVAFVIALGWLAGRTGVLKHVDADVLATYVIRFALPFALLEAALETSPEKIFEPTMAICLTVGLMGSYLMALAAGRFWFRHDLKTATMQALVCGFPDMAYFGAPILAAVFGPSGFLLVLIGNLVTSIIMLPLTIVLTHLADGHDQEHGWKDSLRVLGDSLIGAATNPIVWLPVAGVLCSLVHLSLPHPLTASIAMVARSAGGTSLFALGLMLYGEKVTLNSNVVVNLGIKNFLQPGLMLAAAAVLGMTLTATREAVITGATPTATAAAMFALRNKTYTADATSTILLSTIFGIFTAAGLIALFAAYPA